MCTSVVNKGEADTEFSPGSHYETEPITIRSMQGASSKTCILNKTLFNTAKYCWCRQQQIAPGMVSIILSQHTCIPNQQHRLL